MFFGLVKFLVRVEVMHKGQILDFAIRSEAGMCAHVWLFLCACARVFVSCLPLTFALDAMRWGMHV